MSVVAPRRLSRWPQWARAGPAFPAPRPRAAPGGRRQKHPQTEEQKLLSTEEFVAEAIRKLFAATDALRDLGDEMQIHWDDRSERWQQCEAGAEWQAAMVPSSAHRARARPA